MLTALAASKAIVENGTRAWTIINDLAQRERTGESAADNAVLMLNAREVIDKSGTPAIFNHPRFAC
jgi:hypothetical protein